MSSYLCFICHNTVDEDINEEFRDKYRDLIGMNLCPDSQLCYVCCHMLNKFWMFKSVCLKRSLEYPVLFSEKGTLNLQRSHFEIHTLCPEDDCYNNENREHYNEFDEYNDHKDKFDAIDDYLKLTDEFGYMNDKNINDNYNVDDDEHNNEAYESKKSTPVHSHQGSGYIDDNDDYNDMGNELDTQANVNDNDGEINDDICENNESSQEETVKKKDKSKKSKKKEFDKIILSMEEQKSELERNRKDKKYIEAEFKCYNCALGFLFKDTYQAHMMRHEESNGEYRCETCTLRFASPAVLRSHRALHRERYRCRRCGEALRPRERAPHARECYQWPADVVTCHLCGRVFNEPSGLQQHLKRFHQMKTSTRSYSCNVCGKSYSNQAAVRTHMIKHIHRKFNCEHCNAIFSSPYTLNQHKKKHDIVQTQHYCSTCGLGYSSRKSLLAHIRNSVNHQQSMFECPICSRICPNKKSLSSHIDTVHSTTKEFGCPRCTSRFSTAKALSRHIRRHEVKVEVKMAVCHLCGSCFKGNNKLNRHLREVCEKEKLEEQLSAYYGQETV